MTPEQKQKLDEIRNELAEIHKEKVFDAEESSLYDVCFRKGWNAAIEHLMPAIELLEFFEDPFKSKPKKGIYTLIKKMANEALEKIFGNEVTSEAGDEK